MGWKANVAWAFGTVLCLASVLFIASIPFQLCVGSGDAGAAGRAAACAPERPGWGTSGVMLLVVCASLLGWLVARKDAREQPR